MKEEKKIETVKTLNLNQELKGEKEEVRMPQENLGKLSVVMRDDITNMWKIASENLHKVPMEGFDDFMDPVDYIVKCTYEIWDQKGIGEIYKYYKHNALVHTSDGDTYGRDRVIENCLIKLAGYPDIRDYIDDVIWAPDGDGGFHTSMRWTWTANNTGHTIYGGPTGKRVAVWGIANCYIKYNYIVEEWVAYNEISLIRQLGFDVEEVLEISANKGVSAAVDTGTFGEVDRLNGQFPPEAFGENSGRFSEIEYLVRKNYHDIFNMRQFQRFKENYAVNYTYHGPSDREITGLGDFLQDQLNLFQAFPDLAMNLEDFYYNYEESRREYRCAVRWTILGTHKGIGIYGPATGCRVVITGISHLIIRDGKFIEEWAIYDEMAIRRKIMQARKKAAEPVVQE